MTKNSAYSNIRTYEELESSLQMVHQQIEGNPLSRGVSQLKAVPKQAVTEVDWANVVVFLIRLLQKRLKK